ncbi:MAG: Fic family protein [Cyclobacteriaceae bacterium]
MNKIHTLQLNINWDLISKISEIDRFDASWTSIEKREGQTLKQLKSIATVRSVGASTRIEGSGMNDEQVDILLDNLAISKLEDRDSQEVVGYYEVLDLILGSSKNIGVSENSLKSLHNSLLQYSQKDQWHRGNYKQHSNSVEADFGNGNKQVIFKTTPPGLETDDAMGLLIKWYKEDEEAHPLVKCAAFSYEFVSIHPFQDGNGRLSRLIPTLLLLKNGYQWIQYVSFEHEIESRKNEYYQQLRKCQSQRPNEDVTSWVHFFLDCLIKIQQSLLLKLDKKGEASKLSPRDKSILLLVTDNAGIKSGQVSKKLNIPIPTVKKTLALLCKQNLIEKHGNGPGTNYIIK